MSVKGDFAANDSSQMNKSCDDSQLTTSADISLETILQPQYDDDASSGSSSDDSSGPDSGSSSQTSSGVQPSPESDDAQTLPLAA